jgi:hypothetical protein
MKRYFLLLAFLFSLLKIDAQTNVRAWYADGQVWVVWEVEAPVPLTYAVYAKPTAFTSTADATLLGRPFVFEYLGAALKEQVDTLATFRIPDGQGGLYQLAQNEGLFVATPHQAGALFFAVAAWGESAVFAGENITDAAVPFAYNPANDPVECHLQAAFPSPFAPGFTCFAYMMWADGRQDQWNSRPDFPVMANAAKNGMPSLFFVSAPNDLDTTQAFPLTVWLHGGGGTARQSLAGSRPIVNISPEEGILLAHDDNLVGWRDTVPPNASAPSWHFGWRKNWDPFTPGNFPTGADTVINYTQRRYIWIDEWLARRFNIDTTRISINGHSMGGAGTTGLAKCYPKHYASATIFNNGFGGPENDQSAATFGNSTDDFYTNLTNRAGQKVKFRKVWNIIDNCSPERDWPPMRVYHSKNDDNGTMRWDAYVVENYRAADSLGMGVQLYWSERAHGIDEGPNYNDHWHNGNLPAQQTGYDNTAFEEAHFSSDTWLPAFFNHRLQPEAGDPGDGTLGTSPNGTGDDWGTWGGYHRWEDARIEDGCYGPGTFYVTLWLEDGAFYANDNCPVDFLISDLYVRRLPYEQATYCDFGSNPQAAWFVWASSLDDNYDENIAVSCLGDGDLMKLNDVKIFRKGLRRLELSICLIVPTTSIGVTPFTAALAPNPAQESTTLTVNIQAPSELTISISDISGRVRSQYFAAQSGENRIPLSVGDLPNGLYFVQVVDERGSVAVLKMVAGQ